MLYTMFQTLSLCISRKNEPNTYIIKPIITKSRPLILWEKILPKCFACRTCVVGKKIFVASCILNSAHWS